MFFMDCSRVKTEWTTNPMTLSVLQWNVNETMLHLLQLVEHRNEHRKLSGTLNWVRSLVQPAQYSPLRSISVLQAFKQEFFPSYGLNLGLNLLPANRCTTAEKHWSILLTGNSYLGFQGSFLGLPGDGTDWTWGILHAIQMLWPTVLSNKATA